MKNKNVARRLRVSRLSLAGAGCQNIKLWVMGAHWSPQNALLPAIEAGD